MAKLNTSKLTRRPVQVRGKNGMTFTRMQWVNPWDASTGHGVRAIHNEADLKQAYSDGIHHHAHMTEAIKDQGFSTDHSLTHQLHHNHPLYLPETRDSRMRHVIDSNRRSHNSIPHGVSEYDSTRHLISHGIDPYREEPSDVGNTETSQQQEFNYDKYEEKYGTDMAQMLSKLIPEEREEALHQHEDTTPIPSWMPATSSVAMGNRVPIGKGWVEQISRPIESLTDSDIQDQLDRLNRMSTKLLMTNPEIDRRIDLEDEQDTRILRSLPPRPEMEDPKTTPQQMQDWLDKHGENLPENLRDEVRENIKELHNIKKEREKERPYSETRRPKTHKEKKDKPPIRAIDWDHVYSLGEHPLADTHSSEDGLDYIDEERSNMIANIFGSLTKEGIEHIYSDDDGNWTARLTSLDANVMDNFVRFMVSFKSKNKERMGYITRKVSKYGTTMEVKNDLFSLDDKWQGSGVAEHSYKRSEEMYLHLNEGNKVHFDMYANITVGRYSWATRSKGFNFANSITRDMKREELRGFLEGNKLDEDETMRLCGYNSVDDLVHAHHFAELDDGYEYNLEPHGYKGWGDLGKAFMLTSAKSWNSIKEIGKDADHYSHLEPDWDTQPDWDDIDLDTRVDSHLDEMGHHDNDYSDDSISDTILNPSNDPISVTIPNPSNDPWTTAYNQAIAEGVGMVRAIQIAHAATTNNSDDSDDLTDISGLEHTSVDTVNIGDTANIFNLQGVEDEDEGYQYYAHVLLDGNIYEGGTHTSAIDNAIKQAAKEHADKTGMSFDDAYEHMRDKYESYTPVFGAQHDDQNGNTFYSVQTGQGDEHINDMVNALSKYDPGLPIFTEVGDGRTLKRVR
jgi:hypothetical protein